MSPVGRKTFPVRPAAGGIDVSNPSLYTPLGYVPEVMNCRYDQHSFKKRPGTLLDRSPLRKVYEIVLYSKIDGTRYTLYLTDTDLIAKESGGTFSYKTDTYTTGTISGITTTSVSGNATGWNSSGVAAGDLLVVDSDHSATSEVDANWRTIQTVVGDTSITLSSTYAPGSGTGTYKARKVYSVPDNERWSWAIVDDLFCFGNGNVNVQKYSGTGYATDLDSTYATRARYMIEYANRLFLGDVYVGGFRRANTMLFSKEGDPTDWTDSTSGTVDLIETDDVITGFGKTGGNLIVFKQDNTLVYARQAVATDPIVKTADRRGVGCVAPYSTVSFLGTTAWIGRDDFYIMDGDSPSPIGENIRTEFFDTVGETEIKKVWGAVNHSLSEAYWVAQTEVGQRVYVYNYKYKEWMKLAFPTNVTAFGRGALT